MLHENNKMYNTVKQKRCNEIFASICVPSVSTEITTINTEQK